LLAYSLSLIEESDLRVFNQDDVKWDGLKLRSRTGRLLAMVEPDPEWPLLYRVRLPGGHLTDMLNLTRAKDAARCLALETLSRRNAA
jgi:hypothetical protein